MVESEEGIDAGLPPPASPFSLEERLGYLLAFGEALLDLIPDEVAVLDDRLRVRNANRAFAQAFGVPSGPEAEPVSLGDGPFFQAPVSERGDAPLGEILVEQTGANRTFRLDRFEAPPRPGEESRTWTIRAEPWDTEDPRYRRILVWLRSRAEEESSPEEDVAPFITTLLEEKADRIFTLTELTDRILEMLPVGACLLDPALNILRVNARFEEMLGRRLPPRSTGDRHLFALFPVLRDQEFQEILSECRRTGQTVRGTVEAESSEKSPPRFEVELQPVMLRDENAREILLIVHEVEGMTPIPEAATREAGPVPVTPEEILAPSRLEMWPPSTQARVLVVEPDAWARMILSDIVRSAGFEDVTLMESGEAALASFDPATFALMLVGFDRDEKEAREFCARITETAPKVPVVAVTEREEAAARTAVGDVRILGVLAGPLYREQLRTVVAGVLCRTGEPEGSKPGDLRVEGATELSVKGKPKRYHVLLLGAEERDVPVLRMLYRVQRMDIRMVYDPEPTAFGLSLARNLGIPTLSGALTLEMDRPPDVVVLARPELEPHLKELNLEGAVLVTRDEVELFLVDPESFVATEGSATADEPEGTAATDAAPNDTKATASEKVDSTGPSPESEPAVAEEETSVVPEGATGEDVTAEAAPEAEEVAEAAEPPAETREEGAAEEPEAEPPRGLEREETGPSRGSKTGPPVAVPPPTRDSVREEAEPFFSPEPVPERAEPSDPVRSEPEGAAAPPTPRIVGGGPAGNDPESLSLIRLAESERLPLATGEDAVSRDVASILGALDLLLDFDRFASRVLDIALEITSGSSGSVMLIEDEQRVLRIVASSGLSDQVVEGTRQRVGEGIAGRVAEDEEPMLLVGNLGDDRFRLGERSEIPSSICSPIVSEGQVIGVVNVNSDPALPPFGKADLNRVARLGQQLGPALDRSRQLRRMRGRSFEEAMRGEIEAIINSLLDLDTRLERIASRLVQLLNADTCAIYLVEPESTNLGLRAVSGVSAVSRQALSVPIGTGMVGRVAKNLRPLVLRSGTDASRDRGGFQLTCIGFPIRFQTELIGVLTLESASKTAYDETRIRLVGSLATVIGQSIGESRIREDSQRQVTMLSALSELGVAFAAAPERSSLARLLSFSACTVLGSNICSVRLLREDAPYPARGLEFHELLAVHGASVSGPGDPLGELEELLTREVLDHGGPCRDSDLPLAEIEPYLERSNVSAALGVPLIAADRVVGTVVVYRVVDAQGRWSGYQDHEVEIGHRLCDYAAAAALRFLPSPSGEDEGFEAGFDEEL
jgi:GAF domain-containing protein/CheY-like chemotaxis protein/PAS domain-containing protein